MQLVVARVATAGAVASDTSTRASLEAARHSAEDRAISAETAAAVATTERDSLASRLALAEVEIEKLLATAFAKEAAERAKTAAATTKTTTREASRASAREKAALEAKVLELESDLRMATTDLATTSHQFS
jgi:hypothetical protein